MDQIFNTILIENIQFVYDHFGDDGFNFSNPPHAKDAMVNRWNQLISEGIIQSNTDPFDIERIKLKFLLYNFHFFVGKNSIGGLRLTESYSCSKTFGKDLVQLRESLTVKLSFAIAKDFSFRDISVEERFTACCIKFISFSILFMIPFPNAINFSNRTNFKIPALNLKKNGGQNFINSRKLFDEFCQVYPSFQPIGSGDIFRTIQSFSLTSKEIEQSEISPPGVIRFRNFNESTISCGLLNYYLESVEEALSIKFPNVEIYSQSGETQYCRPDYLFSVTKNDVAYFVPIEIKKLSLEYSLKSLNDKRQPFNRNTKFRELCNQSMYQAILHNSHMSIIIDATYIIIFYIMSKDIKERLVYKDGSILKVLPCQVFCMNHTKSNYNLGIVLTTFTNRYFSICKPETNLAISELRESLKLLEGEVKNVIISRYKLMESLWESRFSDFKKNGEEYHHKEFSHLKIPSQYFEIRERMKEWKIRGDNDFRITENIQDSKEYFSKVFKVEHNGAEYLLKVYDTLASMQIDAETGDISFFKSLSFNISMYLAELSAYLHLRGSPPGLGFPIIDSAGSYTDPTSLDVPYISDEESTTSALNHIPVLIEYGYYKCESFQGFYLLEEYIENNIEDVNSEENFRQKAMAALKKIHQSGIIHGDCHIDNVIYNRRYNRIFIIDFGYSSYTKFQTVEKSVELDNITLSETIRKYFHERRIKSLKLL